MKLTKEFIQEKLATDDKWLIRGILAIYKRQDQDEKRIGCTCKTNHRGFTGADSVFMSSIATWLLSGRTLSSKQIYCSRKRMHKYAGQLLKVAEGK